MAVKEQVREHLLTLLARPGAEELPSIRVLARRLDCSCGTVQAAVKELVAQGRIFPRQGAGLFAAPREQAAALPQRQNAQSVLQWLEERVRQGGLLPGGRFPSLKLLAARCGCGPVLMGKVVRGMASRGEIERDGAGWRLRRVRRNVGRPRIYALAQEDGSGALLVRSDREVDFWRDLGRECLEWAIDLEIVPVQSYGPRRGVPSLERSRVTGLVLSTLHLAQAQEFVADLERLHLPMAVWMESPQQRIRHGQGTLLCDIGYSRHAGAAMGRRLATGEPKENGGVAWISPFHGASWSRERLEGLREGLGAERPLESFCLDLVSEWDLRPGFGEVAARLEQALPGWEASDSLQEDLARNAVSQRLAGIMEPLFRRALDSGASTWVLANDPCALLARQWLLKRGHARHLCGFDDLFEATLKGITSYRFPTAELARAMIRHCLAPEKKGRRVALEGVVVR